MYQSNTRMVCNYMNTNHFNLLSSSTSRLLAIPYILCSWLCSNSLVVSTSRFFQFSARSSFIACITPCTDTYRVLSIIRADLFKYSPDVTSELKSFISSCCLSISYVSVPPSKYFMSGNSISFVLLITSVAQSIIDDSRRNLLSFFSFMSACMIVRMATKARANVAQGIITSLVPLGILNGSTKRTKEIIMNANANIIYRHMAELYTEKRDEYNNLNVYSISY